EQLFREKLEANVLQKNRLLREIYDEESFTIESIIGPYLRYAGWLAPYITDTALLLSRWIDAGATVLFEAPRGRCSTSTTAPIRSSPHRARRRAARARARACRPPRSTACSASRRPIARGSARGPSRPS